MTKSKPELLKALAQYHGGAIDPVWESWHSYRILMELEKYRKEAELPDVSTSSRFLSQFKN